jgi:ribosome-binding factor A
MPGFRNQRLSELIRHELAGLVRDGVDEARTALVTITGVTLSADYRRAKVHVSIFPEAADREGIIAALHRRRGRLKGSLGRALRIRHIPDLEFVLDRSAERSARIDELLRGSDPAAGGGEEDPGS